MTYITFLHLILSMHSIKTTLKGAMKSFGENGFRPNEVVAFNWAINNNYRETSVSKACLWKKISCCLEEKHRAILNSRLANCTHESEEDFQNSERRGVFFRESGTQYA